MKVMVVEDSKLSMRMITRALEKFELPIERLVEAQNGEDALEQIDDIDFVITDWNMPVMEGLEFVKKIRAKGMTIPILMISTNNTDIEIKEALENGVDDYIVKPFRLDELQEKIQALLN